MTANQNQEPEKNQNSEQEKAPSPMFLHQLAWHYEISVDTMRLELEEIKDKLGAVTGKRRRYKYSSKQVAIIIEHLGKFSQTGTPPKYRAGKISK